MKITKQILKRLAEQKEPLTERQRADIIAMSVQMGVEFNPLSGCPNCYRDQVHILWRKLAEQEVLQTSKRKYLLREGVDVVFKGVRINAATLTDKLAAELLSDGFSRHFFLRINGENRNI